MGGLSKLKMRVDRQTRLMNHMIRHLGVDAARLADDAFGSTLGATSRACLFCGHSVACEAWLTSETTAGTPPDFCPNARTFRRLSEDR